MFMLLPPLFRCTESTVCTTIVTAMHPTASHYPDLSLRTSFSAPAHIVNVTQAEGREYLSQATHRQHGRCEGGDRGTHVCKGR